MSIAGYGNVDLTVETVLYAGQRWINKWTAISKKNTRAAQIARGVFAGRGSAGIDPPGAALESRFPVVYKNNQLIRVSACHRERNTREKLLTLRSVCW
jgi:hypothetical protein